MGSSAGSLRHRATLMGLMRRTGLAWSAAFAIAAVCSDANGLEPELSAQAVATLQSDASTKGGGTGPAFELGLPLMRGWLYSSSTVLARARASALFGAGLAWTGELGVAFRTRIGGRFEPDLGVYGLYMGGDLARTIDSSGRLAQNPFALLAGVSPLSFRLDQGSVSVLAIRYGTTLFRSGSPPFLLSVTFVEIRRQF